MGAWCAAGLASGADGGGEEEGVLVVGEVVRPAVVVRVMGGVSGAVWVGIVLMGVPVMWMLPAAARARLA